MTTVKTSVSITEKTQSTLEQVNETLKSEERKILTLSEATRMGVKMISKIPESELCEHVRAFRVEDSSL